MPDPNFEASRSRVIWNKGRPVLSRTHSMFAPEPCWYALKRNVAWFGTPGSENSAVGEAKSPRFIKGGSKEVRVVLQVRHDQVSWGKPHKVARHTNSCSELKMFLRHSPFVCEGRRGAVPSAETNR